MKDLMKQTIKWSVSIAVITFVLAAIFSITSNGILKGVSWSFGLFIVFIIVFIGVFFDVLGIAATAADETPFHAMASRKVFGATHSIRIIKNADRFASFCNDVIGDISGIISGAAAALVIIQFNEGMDIKSDSILDYGLNVLLASSIAAITVGGKAFGKSFAIRYSRSIIFKVGIVLQFLEVKCHIVLLKEDKGKRRATKKRKKRK